MYESPLICSNEESESLKSQHLAEMDSDWAPEIVHCCGNYTTQMRHPNKFVDLGGWCTFLGIFCSIREQFPLASFSCTQVTLGLKSKS